MNEREELLRLIRSAAYKEPTDGTAESAWNAALEHIEEGLSLLPTLAQRPANPALDHIRELFEKAPFLRHSDDFVPGASPVTWRDLVSLIVPSVAQAVPDLENLANRFVSIIQDGIAQEAGSKSIASIIINELLVLRIIATGPSLPSTEGK